MRHLGMPMAIALAVTAASGAEPAAAQSLELDSTTMDISATITEACTTFSVTSVNMGSVTSVELLPRTAGVISVKCTADISYKIGAGIGLHLSQFGAGFRQMSDGGTGRLEYDLEDDNGIQVGDDGCGGTYAIAPIKFTADGTEQKINLWVVQVLPQTVNDLPDPGSYSDTVTLTLCV